MNQTLKRALSGAVYVAIMWFGTSHSEFSFNLLFGIILLVCLYEMHKLRKGKTKILAYTYVLVPFLLILLIAGGTLEYLIFSRIAAFFGMPLSYYSENPFDPSIILLMFILTWVFDTFAYLVGIQYGKHKIMPSVSPKKSWEGFAGGFIFTIIVAYLSQKFFIHIALRDVLFVSIILPFTATLGDFIASHYKREAGVKDSGNFIPGHGGMLDRMDAFTITISVIYLLTNLL
jgi:phosphatidate cytidylyltransferase